MQRDFQSELALPGYTPDPGKANSFWKSGETAVKYQPSNSG